MTDLVRFDTASELRKVAEPFLLQDETRHNLLFGLLSTLEANPNFYGDEPYLAAVLDDASVIAVPVMTPPHNLIISHCDSTTDLAVLADDVHAFRPDTPGVNAPIPFSLRFAEAWQALTGYGHKLEMAMRVYELRQLRSPAVASGGARFATEADVTLLTAWDRAFALDAIPSELRSLEETEQAVRRRLAMPPSERGLLLWEDGQPVSMAGYGGRTPNSLRIGLVYTPPDFRRRGYGSAVTAAVCQHILETGRYCTLFTDLANPTSNHIYQELGFEPVCDVDQYLFTRA